MVRDELIRRALERTNWDLLACSMPANVLLLTGYWPAAGYSVAVATRDGLILLIVPEDEDEDAGQSWADEVTTYCPAPLDRLTTQEEPVYEAFAKARAETGIHANRIGFEQAETFEPPGHAPNLFRGSAVRILRRAFPSATLAPADELLAEMRAVKTPAEIEHIRTACRIAEQAFLQGARLLRVGMTEAEAAAVFRLGLSACLSDYAQVKRCDGFVCCMSGPNAARGSGLYSRSRSRPIRAGDLVLLHCHCYADGYWAEIARTYHVGTADTTQQRMYDAVFAARDAALEVLHAGSRAAEVSQAAHGALESHGLAACIRHPMGSGTGFAAVDHTARPRLHPKSGDAIEPGMVLKLEPGVYIEEYGGVRNSDMVAITPSGPELLTPFHREFGDLNLQ